MSMNASEKTALTKLVASTASIDLSVFSTTELDAKSVQTALDEAKTTMDKKKGDYALVVVFRKN